MAPEGVLVPARLSKHADAACHLVTGKRLAMRLSRRARKAYERFYMLQDQRVSVVQFIQRDMDHHVLLGERHILVHLARSIYTSPSGDETWPRAYLESVVKVSDFAKTVQELIDSCLVVFHKGIESCHVGLLRIRRLVGQILKHLCDLHSWSTEPDRRSPIYPPKSMFASDVWPERRRPTCTPAV